MPSYFDLTDDMRIRQRWHLRAPRNAQGLEVHPWKFFEGRRLEPQGTLLFPVKPTG